MIGFNGGLVGKLRDSVSTQRNPGAWTAREQSIYRAISGKWPTAPTPGDPFPVAYRSLIDNFASTKYFVDATTGSDSNAGTSFATAFATIGKAITTASSGHMIVVYPGSYTNTQTGIGAGAACCISDANKNLQIVCAPGQVKITGSTSAARDYHAVELYNANSNLYGAIIERNSGTRTDNYMTALIGWTDGSIYNCVLRVTNTNNAWSVVYDNANRAFLVDGCLFAANAAPLANYTGGGVSTIQNTASNQTFSIGGTMTNNGSNKTINSDWSVDSGSYGVYSGTYSWVLSTFTYP